MMIEKWTIEMLKNRCEITDDHWLFIGYRENNRYCRVSIEGEMILVHRLSMFLATGKWAKENVNHICEHKNCCNPEHLYEGNQSDNMFDTEYGKGRGGGAKLTEDQVREIKASDKRSADLAREYKVAPGQIYNIRSGLCWAHI